ncbi:hypothetical protein BIV57_13470 [Mangrovactinospora gilvigrisea]|uniref:HTH cro/C1-type domain-containing protein n=1 Tax=Mangrovactinospora gilvigrisea TaxID=1428644 RepID=A0A1J7C609_9ACTN|nr:helix-turn-helix domain-containing protein [Mangrovactinospora gilvigrisea]OIV36992.1 hypothetical protein BIV57_13470 [Mangrovactinospora gilvigrisea]
MSQVAASLRTLREQHGLTIPQLAAASGVQARAIRAYEGGERTPHGASLARLADALDVDPARLTSGGTRPTPTLADLRARAGLSQQEAADAAGLTRRGYGMAESGSTKRLAPPVADALARAFTTTSAAVLTAHQAAQTSALRDTSRSGSDPAPAPATADLPPGLTTVAATAAWYGVSPKTVHGWSQAEDWPQPQRALSSRTLYYPVDAVDAWVRRHRPRAAETAGTRPPAPTVEPATASADAAGHDASAAAQPVEPHAQPRRLEGSVTTRQLAEHLGVDLRRVQTWTADPEFPPPDGIRRGRGRPSPTYPGADVEAWVREHRPAVAGSGLPALPDRDAGVLMDLLEFGRVLGEAWGAEPVRYHTMRSYQSRRQIPPPDRVPGDGLAPPVIDPMWSWSTVARHVRSRPRGPRRGHTD